MGKISSYKLDKIDHRLIELLQTDSSQSIKQLALQLNLSNTPIYERIKKL
ncbi:MAG TPA: AsnC family protein, partial [Crocinitomix sp.]|nr:AsnC family protein [Crocinitomix sp.]